MGIMARAMVIIGIESVVESWVSVMKLTTVKTDLLVKRLLFLSNPDNCDSVVEEAMRLYWSKCPMRNTGDGHFIRKVKML
jgi:hypothetical protein